MFKKIMSLFLSLSLIVTQPIFAQGVVQLNLAQYLGQMHHSATDSFRPTQLRYFSYDNLNNSFRILLDKGDTKDIKDNQLKQEAKELMDYFLIGVTLPNDVFWVNLRPDSPENIIDPELEQTGLGKILLEADLQLKKDTASLTSPQTPEGKAYWDKLYKKAGELFGSENITIPTITRPWIVPGEIIIRESQDSAYIYKATLKVLLEQDHLSREAGSRNLLNALAGKDSSVYNFSDPRLKELNEYSSQIIRETIIPKLTQEVNSSKRYAQLRQVYYSLVLSRWFKQKYSSLRSTRASAHQGISADYISLIDSGNLTNLTAKEPYDKLTYFKQYQESFAKGEYNLKEPVYTPYGQSIRTYMSGGFDAGNKAMIISGVGATVGSSIVGKSLENTANTVPLEVSGNNGQVTFSKQELPLSIAASPVEFEALKNGLLAKIHDSLDSAAIVEKVENIKSLKELKSYMEELLEYYTKEINEADKQAQAYKVKPESYRNYLSELYKKYEINKDPEDVDTAFIEMNKADKESLKWRRKGDKCRIVISAIKAVLSASPLVLESELEVIREARKKLNEYHNDIKDFSKVSLPDLIASLNGTAEKIKEEKGSGSSGEQKEWLDIATELLLIRSKVVKNIEIYREQLSSFYAGIKQNPDIKLGEGQKLDYNEYSQTIKATNDPDEIIAAAEQAYKLVHGAASPAEEIKIKAIYETFKARTIKSADDGEAILKVILAMGKEEEISKEELGITIEVLSPRQVDRVIPVWKIIETIKQAMAGEIQNRGISYMQKAILDILIDDKYPGCAFLRKERLEHFLRYAKNLVDKDYLDAEAVSLIETAIKEKTYGKALNIVMNLSKEKMGQALPEEVAELNKKQRNVDIDNSIPTLSRIVEAYLNNKDSFLSKEEKEIADNMYAASSAASPSIVRSKDSVPAPVSRKEFKDKFFYVLKNIKNELEESERKIKRSKYYYSVDSEEEASRTRAYITVRFINQDDSMTEYLSGTNIIQFEIIDSGNTIGISTLDGNYMQNYVIPNIESVIPGVKYSRKNNQTIEVKYEDYASIMNAQALVDQSAKEDAKKPSTASPLAGTKLKDAGPADFAKGGIDFTDRAMRIGLEPMGSFAGLKLVLPEIVNVAVIDLDNEFKQIQLMASSGIRPSDNRILEFAAACYYRGEFGPRMGEITSCLQQAHFLDERLGRESSPALRLATMLPEVLLTKI